MPRRNGLAAFQENLPGSDYTAEEWEFIRAVAEYQKRFRRRYPTWREVLHIARCLGYRKVAKRVGIDHPAVLPEPEPDLAELMREAAAEQPDGPGPPASRCNQAPRPTSDSV
jgi:hypothetical protein